MPACVVPPEFRAGFAQTPFDGTKMSEATKEELPPLVLTAPCTATSVPTRVKSKWPPVITRPFGPFPPLKSPAPAGSAAQFSEAEAKFADTFQLPTPGPVPWQFKAVELKWPVVGVPGTALVIPAPSTVTLPVTVQASASVALADTAPSVLPPMSAMLATAARPATIFFLLIMQFPPLGCGCWVRAVRWCSH